MKIRYSQVVYQANRGKSNVFQAYDDLFEELQMANEKEKSQKMRYKILCPNSEMSPDKHKLEQWIALKKRLDKIKKEAKINVLAKEFKFNLNII